MTASLIPVVAAIFVWWFATGAIMLGTLLDEMERRDVRRGIVAASGAAGSGVAMMIER